MLLAAAALGACVPAVSRVEAPVHATLRTRLGDAAADDADVPALLRAPLTRASVARIALARSARIRAAFDELGVSAGEAAAGGALGRTDIDAAFYVAHGDVEGGHLEVVQGITELFLAAPRARAATAALSAAQARAAGRVLGVLARADRAYLAVAAATEELAAARTTFDAAGAAADLVERLHTAGGVHDLALAREQSAREEARLTLARAETAVEVAREELNAALGLSGDETRWTLGDGVPGLPDAAPALDDLEATAVATSLELAALRHDALGAANRGRDAAVRAWLPDVGVGVAAEQHDGTWIAGPALRIGLPIFSGDRARASAARADVRRVGSTSTALAVEVRATARAVRMRALAAYDEARHLRDVLVPLRRRVLEETVLQYNAMNAGPLELLAARRDLVVAERMAIDARRRFAGAMIDVEALRHGVAVGESGFETASSPTTPTASEPAGGH